MKRIRKIGKKAGVLVIGAILCAVAVSAGLLVYVFQSSYTIDDIEGVAGQFTNIATTEVFDFGDSETASIVNAEAGQTYEIEYLAVSQTDMDGDLTMDTISLDVSDCLTLLPDDGGITVSVHASTTPSAQGGGSNGELTTLDFNGAGTYFYLVFEIDTWVTDLSDYSCQMDFPTAGAVITP